MRDVRKNYNIFFDGRGYAGLSEEFNAPKLALKTEDWMGGGMFADVELTMGMEKLNADFSLLCVDPDILARFSVVEGAWVPITAREALDSIDGTVKPLIHTMRGKVKEIDPGTSKPGTKATTKITLSLIYYKLTHGVRVVQEIDLLNMIAMRDGIDAQAAIRSAIGL